ncbi:BQ5605_C010g06087 [Microbotryum silenes-dioicae]|uniref:BQ5605_C010g06087 protein n=1 Tax=Microbotryum silenes-dioicae TaxID=796604 RepID=A0A2X0LV17_9BASI|nr:BQ5605_C010g06087 [Microbotryum silenes-dioicae]
MSAQEEAKKLEQKYRTANYKANARGLGREQEEHRNYTMMQGFEWYSKGGGKFWNDFKQKSKSLADMGITAAWLPPPTKGQSPEDNGYGVYDIYDLGEFDTKGGKATKWGTKEEYIDCIKTCKKNGIVVYIGQSSTGSRLSPSVKTDLTRTFCKLLSDAVLNHKAGADEAEPFMATEVDENNRNQDVSGAYEIEGWTKFDFPGRGDKYSDLKWRHHHFTGVDWDNRAEKKAIFKIQGEGKGWALAVDGEKGSFDYLMFADIDHSHPEAREDIKKWGTWIIKETGAEGIRFDAVKHIDEGFISEFVQHIRKELDNPDLFCVGEFWKDDIGSLTGYLDRFGDQFSLFDTALHYNFKEASTRGGDYDLRAIWDGTVVKDHPMDAVTLVDNHDTQPQQALESWIDPTFKPLAYALILFRGDGYPCVFAGDLFGCSSEPFVEPMSQLDDFVRIRKCFTYGPTRDYWDHPHCVGWVREGDADHDGCAVVICNGSEEGKKRMQIPDGHAGEKWTDVLGWYQGEVTIGDDGWAEFSCHERSVSVWAKVDAKHREEFNK